jgi:hypothetical protein
MGIEPTRAPLPELENTEFLLYRYSSVIGVRIFVVHGAT